ncbi:hypothetical protein [uncultured Mucilaginibacter sp.]|uniref:hypothetical protein n=1 Tax=uncultured Mucilaginibacter sp. TaxID=797541 RepID=UPI002623BE07|nr:hypothetical protein [uncultured Mucilaginibacter sp.]
MSEELGNIEFNLTNLITGLTLCSFVLGITNLTVYYYFFSFNVFDYIELSEIAIRVIKDGIMILLPIVVLVISTLFFNGKTIISSPARSNRNVNKLVRYLIITGFLLLASFIFYEYITSKISLPFFLYFIFSFFTTYVWELPFVIKKKLEFNFGIKINMFSLILLSAVILCLTGGILNSLIKVDSVKDKHAYTGTYILIGKDTIISTKRYYYFGRTNNYIFFYNEITKATDVYPGKDINKVSIKFN